MHQRALYCMIYALRSREAVTSPMQSADRRCRWRRGWQLHLFHLFRTLKQLVGT